MGNFGDRSILPTGQVITPVAAPGSTLEGLATGLRADGDADAAQAVNTALSPDGKTLLVMTSGWNNNNRLPDGTLITYPTMDPNTGAQVGLTALSEWVFVYTVNSDGTLTQQQQVNIPSTYSGIAWSPDGTRFYVSGGQDDRVYVYHFNGSQFVPDVPFILLNHNSNANAPFPKYDGSILKGTLAAQAVTFGGTSLIVGGAVVSGVALSRDGRTLVAANFENDSITIVDTDTRTVVREIKFFTPGGTVAQGEFPYDVAVLSNPDGSARTAFVTSQRDDEVMVVDVASGDFSAIPVGAQPNRMVLSPDQKTLYVVNGNDDTISVIDTDSETVVRSISLSRSGDRLKGSNPNSAALSADAKTLYVTLGFENAVAVVDLERGQVRGRIPTGWLPVSPTPFVANLPQAASLEPELRDKTDLFFRGFDQNNADTYLYNEWVRDVNVNGLPNLTLLRLPHDHFGSFRTAIAGLNTPTLQMSDNDFAIGQVASSAIRGTGNIRPSSFWRMMLKVAAIMWIHIDRLAMLFRLIVSVA